MSTLGLLLILVAFLGYIFLDTMPFKQVTDEDLRKQKEEIDLQEKKLARIYWHIDEIKRISDLKSIAIKSGNMEEYEKLCIEKDNLDILYKIENPEE